MKQANIISTDLGVNGRTPFWIPISARLLLVFFVVAGVAALIVTAVTRNSAANNTFAVTPASSIGEKSLPPRPQEKLRTERVTAFPYGFEPDEITRTQGDFMLCIDNRAGTEALSLRLISSETKSLVQAEPIPEGKSGTNKVLSLEPGVYTLTETSHPEWFCTITITQ